MTGPMNGQGHGVDELERRISERLQSHSRLAPDGDGWEAILDRIEQRGRARHRRRAATTGLVLVGMVGALVVVTGGDGTRVRTTTRRRRRTRRRRARQPRHRMAPFPIWCSRSPGGSTSSTGRAPRPWDPGPTSAGSSCTPPPATVSWGPAR